METVGAGTTGAGVVVPAPFDQGQYSGRDRVIDAGLVVHPAATGPRPDDLLDCRGGVPTPVVRGWRAESLREREKVKQELRLVPLLLAIQVASNTSRFVAELERLGRRLTSRAGGLQSSSPVYFGTEAPVMPAAVAQIEYRLTCPLRFAKIMGTAT